MTGCESRSQVGGAAIPPSGWACRWWWAGEENGIPNPLAAEAAGVRRQPPDALVTKSDGSRRLTPYSRRSILVVQTQRFEVRTAASEPLLG